jgi:hypothetical protein
MFDHRREHPFYGICRRTGCELDHAVAKGFRDVRRRRLLTQSASAVRLTVSTSGHPLLPDIGCSSGGSDASRVDTSVRGDIVDLAARSTDIHELPVT